MSKLKSSRNIQVPSKKRSGINRRGFLKQSAVGTAILVTAPALRSVDGINAAQVSSFELDELMVVELQEGMRSGRFTARSLVDKYIARIDAIDRRGPALNSIIEINPEAQSIAESLDRERKSKGPRGPLHGIPVLIKDNIETADRMATTAGSLALVGAKPAKDSFVAQKLREAGAVILAKTNLSEWANFRSTHSSSGWSGRGGQTRNPYALDRNPCGSSSGSGAAVSANLGAIAVGTETDGSIVCPSSANSIVGIKPTVGLVSRAGIIPIAHSQDTAGPMCRTVADAAALLSALAGFDPRDPVTKVSPGKAHPDYTKFLDANGLKGARIGVARNFFGFNRQVDKLMETAIGEMRRLGAIIVDPASIPTAGKLDAPELQVLLFEFKADLNAYLKGSGPGALVRSLKEVIEFNEKNHDKEMPYFGQELMIQAEAKGPLTSAEYLTALNKNRRNSRALGIDAVVKKHRLDVIVAPTGGPPWPTDLLNGDHYTGGSSTPAAVAGYPNINVPAGYIHGLPVGISFFGPAFSEPALIKIAYAFEQGTKHRRKPGFLPTVSL